MHYEVNKSHHNSHWKIPLTSLMGNWTTGRKEYLPTLCPVCPVMIFDILHFRKYFSYWGPSSRTREQGPPKPAKMSVTVSPLVCLMSFTLNRDRQPCLSLNIRIRIYFPARLWRIMRYFVFWSGSLSSHHIKRWWVTEQIWWVSEAQSRQLMISR